MYTLLCASAWGNLIEWGFSHNLINFLTQGRYLSFDQSSKLRVNEDVEWVCCEKGLKGDFNTFSSHDTQKHGHVKGCFIQ